VDGYAVVAQDTFGATESSPAYLKVQAEVAMAELPTRALSRGHAARIATGGALPPGADAVAMLEHTQELSPSEIEVLKPLAPGDNVIFKGQDAQQGELLLEAGSRLSPQAVAALAGVGITSARVYERPRVSIIITGDEVVAPGQPLGAGLIRDMNSYTLMGLLQREGAVALMEGIFRDDYALLREALDKALEHSHMVLITGGSSVGARDYTAGLIQEAGQVLFHGVAMKPGKPTMAGLSKEGKPLFGLPGHPGAVPLCFELFVAPTLRRLAGLKVSAPRASLRARLTKAVSSTVGRAQYVRVRVFEQDGQLWAEPVLGPSGLIRTLLRSHGVVLVPPLRQGLEAQEWVEVLPL
jgi:molybdopterin molybdotransferase